MLLNNVPGIPCAAARPASSAVASATGAITRPRIYHRYRTLAGKDERKRKRGEDHCARQCAGYVLFVDMGALIFHSMTALYPRARHEKSRQRDPHVMTVGFLDVLLPFRRSGYCLACRCISSEPSRILSLWSASRRRRSKARRVNIGMLPATTRTAWISASPSGPFAAAEHPEAQQ